jgi:hypothetical protein
MVCLGIFFDNSAKSNSNRIAMQGANTMLLTYSGPANTPDKRQAKREKRREAGCVDRFCQMSTNGGRNSSLDSCDDVSIFLCACNVATDFLPSSGHRHVVTKVATLFYQAIAPLAAFQGHKMCFKVGHSTE